MIAKAKPGREMARITLLMDQAEIKRLKYMAVDQRVSTSELVRRAVKTLSAESSKSSCGNA